MFRNIVSSAAILTLCFTMNGCGGRIKEQNEHVSAILGKDWVCKTVPDGFFKSGVVFEVRDGTHFFEADFSDKSILGPAAMGELRIKEQRSYGSVFELLKAIDFLSADAQAEASLSTKTNMSINYGRVQKHVLGGTELREIIRILSGRGLYAESQYVIIRESFSTKSLDVEIDRSAVNKLAGTVDINELVRVNPKIEQEGQTRLKIVENLEEPVGVCALAYTLRLEPGLDGQNTVEIGNAFTKMSDKPISKR